jgi:hypothetical protein
VTDLDASLVQQVLNVAKRKWEPDVQYPCKADDLWARLEISKWAVFCHQVTLGRRTSRLKPVSSDSATIRPKAALAHLRHHRRIHPAIL